MRYQQSMAHIVEARPETSEVPSVVGGIAGMSCREITGVGNHLAGCLLVTIHGPLCGTAGYQLAAAPDHVSQKLVEQLAPGGRLVIPVGRFFQELLVSEKQEDASIRRESLTPVRWVPMRGEADKAAR